jgi:hypothetical protein
MYNNSGLFILLLCLLDPRFCWVLSSNFTVVERTVRSGTNLWLKAHVFMLFANYW